MFLSALLNKASLIQRSLFNNGIAMTTLLGGKSLSRLNVMNVQKMDKTNFRQVEYPTRGVFTTEFSPRGNQYKPNVQKRIKTYGLKTKLQTRGGQQMLWRKILKGPSEWVKLVPAP
jgi:ribosomal protein L34